LAGWQAAGDPHTVPGVTAEQPSDSRSAVAAGRSRPGRRFNGRTLADRQHERREAMLAAGLELFGTKGYASTTVDEVARRAHVSTRNFYEEFENRLDLLIAVGERIAAEAFAALTTAQVPVAHAHGGDGGGTGNGKGASAARFRARMAALVHALVDDPRVARVAFVETLAIDPVDGSRRHDALRIFPEWIGTFLRDHLDGLGIPPRRQRALATGAFGACYERISDWVRSPDRQDPASLDDLVDVEDLVDDVVELATVILRLPG
jgi:AcrR family transcriptional regulator